MRGLSFPFKAKRGRPREKKINSVKFIDAYCFS